MHRAAPGRTTRLAVITARSQSDLNAALSSIPVCRRVPMISLEVRGDDDGRKRGGDVAGVEGDADDRCSDEKCDFNGVYSIE